MADRQPKGVRYLLAKMEPQAGGCIWYTGRVRPEDGYTRLEAGWRRCLTCQREREAGRSRSDRKAPC